MSALEVLAIATGALLLAWLAFVPLFLPWPQRVRWTVAAQRMGDVGCAFAMCAPPDVREVVLVSVDDGGDGPVLALREAFRREQDVHCYRATSAVSATVVAMLREWSVLHTPMLLHVDASGIASLTGPAATVAGLRGVGNGRRPAPSRPPPSGL